MNIKITGRHLEISPEIKTFIENSLKVLEKFEHNIFDANFTIELNGKRYKVELEVNTKKHRFTSSDESYELMTSIDRVIDKMKTQLKKYEEKKHDR